MLDAMPMQVELDPGFATAVDRVRVECEGPAAALLHLFQAPLTRVLARRSGRFEVRLTLGCRPGEMLAVISAAGRRMPLELVFPEAESLSTEDVERIVHSVLEGMGPLFP